VVGLAIASRREPIWVRGGTKRLACVGRRQMRGGVSLSADLSQQSGRCQTCFDQDGLDPPINSLVPPG